MREHSALIFMFAVAILLYGCVGYASGQAGPSSTQSATQPEDSVPPLPVAPVDTTLTPVSRSNPGAEAQAALDRCVRADQMDQVAGMALLASARDVRKYTYTNGNEPELQDDVPVWAIQLEGPVVYRVWTEFHPLCVVKNGSPTVFAPYGGRGPKGAWEPPTDAGFVGPQLALPSLAP